MKRITRLLLAAAAGGASILFLGAAPASAAGETIGGCVHEKHEEFLADAEGLDPDSDAYHDLESDYEDEYETCLEAPNPLVPEINEVIWGTVGFVVVLAFLAKFGIPAVRNMTDERTARIRADLDAAEQAKVDAEAVKADYEAKVADARAEAALIIEGARQAADQLRSDQQVRLNDELAAARAQAQADIDAAKGQAMAELRGEVATIAIGAAESVVGANLDRDAQIRLVEDYINRVSNQ